MSGLSAHLQLRQQQRLVMTPQLKQALKILQLNTVELGGLIEAELAENPMLEELGAGPDAEAVPALSESEASAEDAGAGPPSSEPEAGDPKSADPAAEAAPEQASQGSAEPAAESAPESPTEPPSESTGELDLSAPPGELDDWVQYLDDDGTDYSLSRAEREDGEEKPGFDAFLSRSETLQEHLLRQLDSEDLEPSERRLREEVVGRLDERGYLEGSLEDLARDCGASEGEVFHALRAVQALDPPGVAARDLRECLLLQLEALGAKGTPAWDALEEHYDDVVHRRWERLAKALKLEKGEAAEAEALVASLEPIPGRPYGGAPNAGVRVDAVVEKDPQTGEYKVIIADGGLPRLGFNAYYRRLLKAGGPGLADADTRNWLKEKQQAALWLMRGIEQRHRTLRRVLGEIVEAQKGFLDHGPAAFRPLTLKDIAVRTGLHESTISRVCTGKYVQTPRGVFELKFFFTSALRTDDGETSSRAVKDRLKELFREEEEGRKPRSDQELAELLSSEGVRIARRTVAKYREELRVPPAHLRRRP